MREGGRGRYGVQVDSNDDDDDGRVNKYYRAGVQTSHCQSDEMWGPPENVRLLAGLYAHSSCGGSGIVYACFTFKN